MEYTFCARSAKHGQVGRIPWDKGRGGAEAREDQRGFKYLPAAGPDELPSGVVDLHIVVTNVLRSGCGQKFSPFRSAVLRKVHRFALCSTGEREIPISRIV